jgi:hypothetical protein
MSEPIITLKPDTAEWLKNAIKRGASVDNQKQWDRKRNRRQFLRIRADETETATWDSAVLVYGCHIHNNPIDYTSTPNTDLLALCVNIYEVAGIAYEPIPDATIVESLGVFRYQNVNYHLIDWRPYRAGIPFTVKLTQTGGTGGNATTKPSWTYTVKDVADNTLATAVGPDRTGTAIGPYLAAGYGIGWYEGETLKFIAYEAPNTEACE